MGELFISFHGAEQNSRSQKLQFLL